MLPVGQQLCGIDIASCVAAATGQVVATSPTTSFTDCCQHPAVSECAVTLEPVCRPAYAKQVTTSHSGGSCDRRAVGKHALLIFDSLCSVVQAGRRWCLSGTPIQNSVEDLYSCFRFLRYNPYCKKAAFKTMLKDPLQDHPAKGAQLLQICLKVCQPIHLLLNPCCC